MRMEVTLQFPSLRALYLFCAALHPDSFELNERTCLLTCACSEEDISLAVVRYGATQVIKQNARLGEAYK